MPCYLLSGYGVPCIRKRTCILLLNNEIVPPIQNNVTCMLMFFANKAETKNHKSKLCAHYIQNH